MWRERVKLGYDSDDEIAFELLLMMLTRHGMLYDPLLTIEHDEFVDEALRSPNGTLFITVHMMLSSLLLRRLHGAGTSFAAVTTVPLTIPGTNEQSEVLLGPMALREAARRLRAGGAVVAMIDRGDPDEPNLIEFETERGSKRIADALVRLAVRENAGVVFFCGRLRGRSEVTISLGRPAPESSSSASAVAHDFISFVQAHTTRS
jgi:lauroyl/myristoyl acyltransferase